MLALSLASNPQVWVRKGGQPACTTGDAALGWGRRRWMFALGRRRERCVAALVARLGHFTGWLAMMTPGSCVQTGIERAGNFHSPRLAMRLKLRATEAFAPHAEFSWRCSPGLSAASIQFPSSHRN